MLRTRLISTMNMLHISKYKIVEMPYQVVIKCSHITSPLVKELEEHRPPGMLYLYKSVSWWECRFKKQQFKRTNKFKLRG